MDLTGYDYKRRVLEKKIAEQSTAGQTIPEQNISVQPVTRPELARSAELTDAALRLLEALPRKYSVSHLAARFPRVLNRIAAVWSQPALVESCIDGLMLDSRGSRAGFPPAVLNELLALRSCNASRILPKKIDPWQQMHLR